jgi:hypothetical protein
MAILWSRTFGIWKLEISLLPKDRRSVDEQRLACSPRNTCIWTHIYWQLLLNLTSARYIINIRSTFYELHTCSIRQMQWKSKITENSTPARAPMMMRQKCFYSCICIWIFNRFRILLSQPHRSVLPRFIDEVLTSYAYRAASSNRHPSTAFKINKHHSTSTAINMLLGSCMSTV